MTTSHHDADEIIHPDGLAALQASFQRQRDLQHVSRTHKPQKGTRSRFRQALHNAGSYLDGILGDPIDD